MKPQLIFLGAPGAGKGTQAKLLVDEWGYKHLSTGDLLREEIRKGTPLGRKIEKIVKKGILVDDQIVLQLLQNHCDLKAHNYIFDGFPRRLDQAKALDDIVLKGIYSLAVYFKVESPLLLQRLANRRVCHACGAIYNLKFKPPKEEGVCDFCEGVELTHREDDREDTVRKRLGIFEKRTASIVDYYKKKGNLHELEASLGLEAITLELKKIVNKEG